MQLVIENVWTTAVDALPEEQRFLVDYLTFDDDQARFTAAHFGKKHAFQADTRMHLFSEAKQRFPTGLVFGSTGVLEGLRENGFEAPKLVDLRHFPGGPDPEADLAWLRADQEAAVDAMIEHGRGIAWMATGAGKTEIQFGMIRSVPCHWLMLVHQADLLDQHRKRWLERGGNEPGVVGTISVTDKKGRKKKVSMKTPDPGRRFTIATFQTILRALNLKETWVLDLLADVEGLLVDETHVAAAKSFYKVIMACRRAYYRYGFSATPLQRSDRKSIFTVAALGPVIHTVRAHTLIEDGLLARPKIRMVSVRQDVPHEMERFDHVYQAVVQKSVLRNEAVLGMVKQAAKPCWVFVKSVAHGKVLAALIKRFVTRKVEFVWGQTSARNDAIVRNANGETDVLVCSVVFQAGVDQPNLAAVVIASAGKSVIAALQKVGRGMRLSAGKDTFEVWDVYDEGVREPEPEMAEFEKGKPHPVARHAKERVKAYLAEKFETVSYDLETGKEMPMRTRRRRSDTKQGSLF